MNRIWLIIVICFCALPARAKVNDGTLPERFFGMTDSEFSYNADLVQKYSASIKVLSYLAKDIPTETDQKKQAAMIQHMSFLSDTIQIVKDQIVRRKLLTQKRLDDREFWIGDREVNSDEMISIWEAIGYYTLVIQYYQDSQGYISFYFMNLNGGKNSIVVMSFNPETSKPVKILTRKYTDVTYRTCPSCGYLLSRE